MEIAQYQGVSLKGEELLNTNKEGLQQMAMSVIQSVAEGESDPMRVLITAKKGIEFLTQVEKNVKKYVAGQQIQKGGLTMFNATLTEKSDPAKWDYSGCNDYELLRLNSDMEELKAKIKKRETFLQSLTSPVINPDTGEEINPAVKTFGAMNVSVTLK